MPALDLEEFAKNLRVRGGWREADFAAEILALLDLEEEVAEPYSDLCEGLRWDVPDGLKDKPEKALEYLRDRSNLLADIEAELEKTGRRKTGTHDVADLMRGSLGEIDDIEMALKMHGFELDEFFDAITKPEASLKVEFDL